VNGASGVERVVQCTVWGFDDGGGSYSCDGFEATRWPMSAGSASLLVVNLVERQCLMHCKVCWNLFCVVLIASLISAVKIDGEERVKKR